MALADRIKDLRTRAGLTQQELAARLHVSRQAVTKWESGRGVPDVENLRAMARLFDVSVDHLLDDAAAPLGDAVLRHRVDVASLEPYRPAGRPLGAKTHTAVRQAFPDATIWPLSRLRRNTRVQEGIEWVTMLLFDAPYGLFGSADALSHRDAHYLVEQKNRQLLARVGAGVVESRELTEPVAGRTFTLGLDTFRKGPRAL